jgi:hypothetical protein
MLGATAGCNFQEVPGWLQKLNLLVPSKKIVLFVTAITVAYNLVFAVCICAQNKQLLLGNHMFLLQNT